MNEEEIKLNDASLSLPDMDLSILEEMKEVAKQRGQGDWNNSLPQVNVNIPASIVIDCPKVKSGLIQAKSCKSCPHFVSVVQISFNDKVPLPWPARYAIRCGWALERKCNVLVITS